MRRPLLLAHRGARRRAPENTLAAFDQALADGCDGFEFDVRRTGDGLSLICHNPSFHGLNIAGHTLSGLSQLIAGRKIAAEVCCLDDVLKRYSGRAYLDIELKDTGLEQAVAAALRQYRPTRCIVSSFLPDVIDAMHNHAPDVPLGLIADTRREIERWRDLPVSFVIVQRALLAERTIEELHAAAKQVLVWTVNRQREMLRFAEWSVDGIISDDAELLSRTFAEI